MKEQQEHHGGIGHMTEVQLLLRYTEGATLLIHKGTVEKRRDKIEATQFGNKMYGVGNYVIRKLSTPTEVPHDPKIDGACEGGSCSG